MRLATAGADSLIKVDEFDTFKFFELILLLILLQFWDTRDGEYVRSLKGHTGEVICVRYSNDELFLVSSGSEGSVLVWDLVSDAILRTLRGHCDVVCWCEYCSFLSIFVSHLLFTASQSAQTGLTLSLDLTMAC